MRSDSSLVTVLLLLMVCLFSPSVLAQCSPAQTVSLQDLRAGKHQEGVVVTVEGVVSATFFGDGSLGGFFLQQGERRPTGIFVYAPELDESHLVAGRQVQLTGRFARFHGRPQLARVQVLHDCGEVGLPKPVPLRLPASKQELGRLAAVKVRFEQPLSVSGNYELARYGSLSLSVGGRLWREDEDAAARRIELDDGSYRANPRPIPYLDSVGTRRSGSTVEGLTGILTHAFDAWRIHPTRVPQFIDSNPRPAPLASSGEALRIATFNVENYFVTLGRRGAANRAEQALQREKLRATVQGLDADILVLSELENRPEALADLLRQLNNGLPTTRQYRAVRHPYRGEDAIKVALLYRPARVEWLEAAADRDRVHSRAPLLAWFRARAGGEPFAVTAVHFKAKTACPPRGDVDRGEGCWNQLRTRQAKRLVAWTDQQRRDGAAMIIAGDLNAYLHEQPLRYLAGKGKRDQVSRYRQGGQGYSYVFHAQAGRLDYLLASERLAGRVVSGGIWHINADEPPFLAYGGAAPADGPWRSSDHDPVWLELR